MHTIRTCLLSCWCCCACLLTYHCCYAYLLAELSVLMCVLAELSVLPCMLCTLAELPVLQCMLFILACCTVVLLCMLSHQGCARHTSNCSAVSLPHCPHPYTLHMRWTCCQRDCNAVALIILTCIKPLILFFPINAVIYASRQRPALQPLDTPICIIVCVNTFIIISMRISIITFTDIPIITSIITSVLITLPLCRQKCTLQPSRSSSPTWPCG